MSRADREGMLSRNESRFLRLFRRLSPADRKALIEKMRERANKP